jgi:hypothetical protein
MPVPLYIETRKYLRVISAYSLCVPRLADSGCYDSGVFNFGNPKTPGQWLGHFVMAVIGLFLIWWMLRVYVH